MLINNSASNVVEEVTSLEAWEILQKNSNSYLIDVRTVPEWKNVGYPNLSSIDRKLVKLSWRVYPTMQINTDFVTHLVQEIPQKEANLLFICKTGGRSYEAALEMKKNGFINCFNIIDGFEGDIDHTNSRGNINGWKALNLPWEQV
jgi:rhodanese-related sulfurtransferase